MMMRQNVDDEDTEKATMQTHQTDAESECCVAGNMTASRRPATVRSPAPGGGGGKRALRSCCRRMSATPRQHSQHSSFDAPASQGSKLSGASARLAESPARC